MVETEFKIAFSEKAISQKTAAVIVAAGSASRMQGIDKQFAEISGISVLERSVMAFQNSDEIDSIVIVARKEKILDIQKLLCDKYSKITDIVAGGKTRAESVREGVLMCGEDVGIILIHDGARPFVSADIIASVKNASEIYGAAACAVKLKDTVKQIEPSGKIIKTPSRAFLVAVQTPQGFRADIYKEALKKTDLSDPDLTDDCSLLEKAGYSPFIVEGSYDNIKITTPGDILLGEAILRTGGNEICE